MTHSKILISLWLVLMLLLTACGGASKDIVGEWRTTNPEIIFEFFPDGTVTWEQAMRSFTGQYKFIDNNNIRLDMIGDLGQQAVVLKDVSISGDSLNLTLDGRQHEFKRTKQEGGPQSTPFTAGPNLAPNPSFEVGSNKKPSGWISQVLFGKASIVWDNTTAHSGKRSMAITNSVPGNKDGDMNIILVTASPIPIDSEHEYELSVCYRYTGKATGAKAPMLMMDIMSGYISFLEPFEPSNDWRCVTGTGKFADEITSSISSVKLSLLVTNDLGGGGVWIDDVSFRSLSK
jgi:hypothetical protein